MADTGLKLESATIQRLADGRFLGQGFDLVVTPAARARTRTPRRAARGSPPPSRSAYREKFALTPPGVPVEFINIRVAVRAPVSGSEVVLAGTPGRRRRARAQGEPPRVFPRGGRLRADRGVRPRRLGVGDTIAGPAVVEEEGSTLVIGPGATARVAPSGKS